MELKKNDRKEHFYGGVTIVSTPLSIVMPI